MEPFRLIIAGSRGIDSYGLLRQAVVKSGLWKKYGKRIEVVSGMAKGVDALGVEFAKNNGLVVHEFPANWNAHGKAAGILRNIEMAEQADGLLALWDGSSPGTKHMIACAKTQALEVHAYECHLMWTLEEVNA